MKDKIKKTFKISSGLVSFSGLILCVAMAAIFFKKQFFNALIPASDRTILKESLFVKPSANRVLYGVEKGILKQHITTFDNTILSVQYFSDFGKIKSLVSSCSFGKGRSVIHLKTEVVTRFDSVFLINFEDKTIRIKNTSYSNSLLYLDFDNLSKSAMDSMGITYPGDITYLNHTCSHFKENNQKNHLSGDLYVYKNIVLYANINNNNLLTKIETVSFKEESPSPDVFLLPAGFSIVENNCN